MQIAPDKWDAKAERIHARPEHEGTPVRVVGLGLPFSTVFVLAFQVAIAQAIIAGIVLVILLAVGAI
jgi:hypothetical protein